MENMGFIHFCSIMGVKIGIFIVTGSPQKSKIFEIRKSLISDYFYRCRINNPNRGFYHFYDHLSHDTHNVFESFFSNSIFNKMLESFRRRKLEFASNFWNIQAYALFGCKG
ncbi:MAG: hypothetical protein MOIL_00204 [Candidatus Methanolliviera sp. GoM_oil]|nr:MAG: hypothetical protein MOIL_00204 [Candidatus Methanolliviera sp. GoM_oil]